ncbi:MAG: VWA domain-containing protein, partial [Actinomycetota bacterium]
MSFSQPLWLAALPIIPLVWWIHRHGAGAVSRGQRTIATVVRSAIVACLVLALSGIALALPARRLATVFVVDASDSMSPAAAERAEEFVRRALAGKPADAQAGVVVFGNEARVELSVQQDPELVELATRPDATRTDISRALRLAAALMPEGTKKRVVLLSDGRENSGDARAETDALERAGLRLDAVSLSGGAGPDAAVLEVETPSRARIGERLEIEVNLFANSPLRGRLVLRRGNRVLEARRISLAEGERTLGFGDRVTKQGSALYRAELQVDRDSVPQNDSSSALTVVSGAPRVVLVEGSKGEGLHLQRALESRHFIVSRSSVTAFPAAEELAQMDAIVLVDVAADALTTVHLDMLRGFVRDLGRGLVTVGGESSWSLGEYRDSPLEDLLPLDSDIKDPRRRPSIAQVLVVDKSGSMAD